MEKEVEIGFLRNVGAGVEKQSGSNKFFFQSGCALSILTNGMLMIDHLNEESKLIEASFEYVPCSEKDDATIYRQRKY